MVTRRVLLDSADLATLNEWLDSPVAEFPAWTGKRIFQVVRFGIEMQYIRIVSDEFAPTIAGLKDVFSGFHTSIDPSITAESSQSVYRCGHSMLTETVDRYAAIINPIVGAGSFSLSQTNSFRSDQGLIAGLSLGELWCRFLAEFLHFATFLSR